MRGTLVFSWDWTCWSKRWSVFHKKIWCIQVGPLGWIWHRRESYAQVADNWQTLGVSETTKALENTGLEPHRGESRP